MYISYQPLWKTSKKRGMKKEDLRFPPVLPPTRLPTWQVKTYQHGNPAADL